MALARSRAGSMHNMAPRGGAAPLNANKVFKKERILQALTKMNDRDTQKAAAEDLISIVYNMDQEGLPIILSCLCTTGSEHKVYARKECARAIGIIASEACPLRYQALQPPHLGKMLGQLRKSLQDADSSVREASSEALALIAQGLAQLAPGSVAGSLTNPAVKLVFECLGEQRKELNAAACGALGMAAPFLGTLDPSLAKDLVRKLNSASFQAPGALLAALARTDPATGEPSGLVKSGPAAFLPILSSLVGQPAPPALGGAGGSSSGGATSGSGAVGALSRPDWQVRQTAADMLRATALLLGPLMEVDGSWAAGDPRSVTGRAIKGLESCRFDKVREVRDVARAALAVLEDLQEYGTAGRSASDWPAFIAERLQGRGMPAGLPGSPKAAAPAAMHPSGLGQAGVRRSQVSPARRPRSAQQPQPSPSGRYRSPTPPERRSSPVLARGGSVAERFRAAHRDNDIAVHDPLGRFEEASWSEEQPSPEEAAAALPWPGARSRHCSQDDTLPDAAPSSRVLAQQPARGGGARGRVGEADAALKAQLSARTPRQPPVGAADPDSCDPAALLQRLGLEGDDVLDMEGLDGPPTFSQQVAGPATSAPTVLPGMGPSNPSLAGPGPGLYDPQAPPPSAASLGPTTTMPTEQWLAAQQRLRALEAQQRELLAAFNSLSEQSGKAISGLQAKVGSLEAALEAAQAATSSQSQDSVPQVPGPQQETSLAAQDSEASVLMRTMRHGARLLQPAVSGGAPDGRLERQASDSSGVFGPSGMAALPLPSPSPSPRNSLDVYAGALGAGGSATDLRQAYREALSGGRSDMHLLRLMQRTGPAWNELGHHLASQLLAAFTASLQQARADSPMLSRMMPWLWRLADDMTNQFEAPFDMRAPLLAALRSVQPSVTDTALYDKISLLITTLRTHWSLPDPSPSSSRADLPQHPSLPAALPASAPSSAPPTSRLANAYSAMAVGAAAQPPQPAAAAAIAAAMGGFASPASPTPAQSNEAASTEPPSPMREASVVTPVLRAPAQMQNAARSPSISSLMGQWSDLQRDYAAMASPAAKLPMPPSQAR